MTSYTELQNTTAFEGENAAYLESLYEQYLQDPSGLSAEWQKYFAAHFQKTQQEPIHSEVRKYFLDLARHPAYGWPGPNAMDGNGPRPSMSRDDAQTQTQLNVYQLIQAYRRFGHLQAKIDPLNLMPKTDVAALTLQHYGLSAQDTTEYDADELGGCKTATVKKIFALCQQIYASSIGFEYAHIDEQEEVSWLQRRCEQYAHWQLTAEQKVDLLKELTATEGLEKDLNAKYVGVTRFSVEGGDSQIPLLNYILKQGGAFGIKEAVIGMAHRGRLNVLVNVLGMPAKAIFSQFEGTYEYAVNRSDDVKYHYGYSADLETPNGPLHASLAYNPSHLEIISPVVQGSVRARQDRRQDTRGDQVLAIQFHGDSAFAGQGIVMETFQLSQTRGFKVGGSLHLIVNNQVGFTTSNPQDTRSSRYCTDPAKMIGVPVFHVNADDPEAVLFIAKLALEYHLQFHKDVVIDLVCYRRYGHNEGDEPSATQPLMYQVIRKLPTVRKLYADQLVQQNVVTQQQVDDMAVQYRDALTRGEEFIKHVANPDYVKLAPDWTIYETKVWNTPCKTALSTEEFQAIASKLTQFPENFKLQTQVGKIIANRAAAYEGKVPLIWGDAEMLAYASLLHDQYRVRLVGQDSGRGTFAHRHAVLHDQNSNECYTSLNHLSATQASFTVIDSLLSENAVMGFEYGYACTEPRALVLWEAQYGDFANGAQVIIDQFLASGEQKWGRYCGLTLLLPHGYEGAGPEHSSCRLERYLQLCAQDNMQVCVPSTPAQMFHILRRQALRLYRKPLVLLTPKALLRKATSSLDDILQGEFKLVIGDDLKTTEIKRVILCSGKVYYDLHERRESLKLTNTAIVRIEQLCPFPKEAVIAELAKYAKTQAIVWCQEEHENQGAWRQIRHHLEACLQPGQRLSYAGRAASASTAAGYKKLHEKELVKFLNEVFE